MEKPKSASRLRKPDLLASPEPINTKNIDAGQPKSKTVKSKQEIETEASPSYGRAKDSNKNSKEAQVPVTKGAIKKEEKINREVVKEERAGDLSPNVNPGVKQKETSQQENDMNRNFSKQGNRSTKSMQIPEQNTPKVNVVSVLVSPGKTPNLQTNSYASPPGGREMNSNRTRDNRPQSQQEDGVSNKSYSKDGKYSFKGQSMDYLGGEENMNKYSVISQRQKLLAQQLAQQNSRTTLVNKSKVEANVQVPAPKKIEVTESAQLTTTMRAKSPESAQPSAKRLRLNFMTTEGQPQNISGEVKRKRLEKPKMRSFDAGKTDKIRADDSFETRNKIWQIRKQEKLLEQEKMRLRKETEVCTFNPHLSKKAAENRQVNATSVYERNVEWNEKVKSAIMAKGEEILEETKRPILKRVSVKPFAGTFHVEPRATKMALEGIDGPQFCVPKTIKVPTYCHDPLEFRGNLDEKVNEIQDIYDTLSSALKSKSLKSVLRQSTEIENQVLKTVESKSTARLSIQKNRDQSKKSMTEVDNPEEKRVKSLKGVLGSKQDDKVNIAKGNKQLQKKKERESYGVQDEISQTEELLKRSNQRVEIRNNRYVFLDNSGGN